MTKPKTKLRGHNISNIGQQMCECGSLYTPRRTSVERYDMCQICQDDADRIKRAKQAKTGRWE